MDKVHLLALLDSLVEDHFKENIETLRGPKGSRGISGNDFQIESHEESLKSFIHSALYKLSVTDEFKEKFTGPKGESFDFENHVEEIESIIQRNLPKKLHITEAQLSSIKGEQGERGERGEKGEQGEKGEKGDRGLRGQDGKDFDFEENKEALIEIAKTVAIQNVSDLSAEDIDLLRGPKGDKGERGQGFDFDANRREIELIIQNVVDMYRDRLKLHFTDLTEEEKESLKGEMGPRGLRGPRGHDFSLDEAFPRIQEEVACHLIENKDLYKLRFSDLTAKEIEDIKLKFSDLTPDEVIAITGKRGPRGLKGLQGEQGEKGETGDKGDMGAMGPRGPIGPKGFKGDRGTDGFDGRDGVDGKDAPEIVSVDVEEYKDGFVLIFGLSDGSKVESTRIKLPKGDTIYYYPAGIGSGGGGGSGSGGTTVFAGEGQPDPDLGEIGDVYFDKLLNTIYGPKTEDGWGEPLRTRAEIGVSEDNVQISDEVRNIDFTGNVDVSLMLGNMSDWDTLSDVDPLHSLTTKRIRVWVRSSTSLYNVPLHPSVNPWNVVYFNGTLYDQALASDGPTGIVTRVDAENGVGDIQLFEGSVPYSVLPLNNGDVLYASNSIRGAVTTNAPTLGQYEVEIGTFENGYLLFNKRKPKIVSEGLSISPNWRAVEDLNGDLVFEKLISGVWTPKETILG